MKNRLFTILAVVILSGCSEFLPSDGRFYVRHIEAHKDRYKYQLVSVDGRGSFFMWGKPNEYMIGDTLTVQK